MKLKSSLLERRSLSFGDFVCVKDNGYEYVFKNNEITVNIEFFSDSRSDYFSGANIDVIAMKNVVFQGAISGAIASEDLDSIALQIVNLVSTSYNNFKNDMDNNVFHADFPILQYAAPLSDPREHGKRINDAVKSFNKSLNNRLKSIRV